MDKAEIVVDVYFKVKKTALFDIKPNLIHIAP
jgi:hypothetical protein